MQTFRLEILTPQRVFYRGESQSLIVPITDGMLGIMANREPVTASLTSGEAYYTKPDGEKVLFSICRGGIPDGGEDLADVGADLGKDGLVAAAVGGQGRGFGAVLLQLRRQILLRPGIDVVGHGYAPPCDLNYNTSNHRCQ